MRFTDKFLDVVNSGLGFLRGRRTEFTGDDLFRGGTIGGVPVTEDTALQLAAFWASVRYLSSAIAMTPWGVFMVTPDGGRQELRNHRIWMTLRQNPSPDVTSFMLRETMMWNALVTGNSLAEIAGDTLTYIDEPVRMVKTETGLAYELLTSNRVLLSADVFHLRGPSRDGLIGLSVISAVRECIGLGLAEQTYGSSFYGAGTHVGGVYEYPGQLKEEHIKQLRQRIEEDRGPGKAHKPRILTEGMTYKSDTIPPQDAQFLESRKYSAREIASLFGVPPHKIGIEDGATAYASREQAANEAVIDGLMPWAIRNEQEGNLKLLTAGERKKGQYTHMNLDIHQRGDTKTRSEGYKVKIRNGVMTPNEARAKEEMNAVPEGSDLLISRDLVPLVKAADLADSQIEKNANSPSAFAPVIADAMACIKKRAKQNKTRGRPPDKSEEFARLKLEPIKAAHELAELPFNIDELIKEGVSDD